jgi:hypothetical protein
MAGLKDWTGTILLVVIVVAIVYLMDPTFFGLIKTTSGFADKKRMESFEDMMSEEKAGSMTSTGEAAPGQMENKGEKDKKAVESNPHVAAAEENFEDMTGAAEYEGVGAPAGCYAREQINPSELLPQESGAWAEQNPSGPGSLKGKNFLTAGSLIGVNTVGQSLKNASWDLRSEPANPQQPVSIFNNSTYQPDLLRRPLEIQ